MHCLYINVYIFKRTSYIANIIFKIFSVYQTKSQNVNECLIRVWQSLREIMPGCSFNAIAELGYTLLLQRQVLCLYIYRYGKSCTSILVSTCSINSMRSLPVVSLLAVKYFNSKGCGLIGFCFLLNATPTSVHAANRLWIQHICFLLKVVQYHWLCLII